MQIKAEQQPGGHTHTHRGTHRCTHTHFFRAVLESQKN